MSVKLLAPHPGHLVTTQLPNPKYGNKRSPDNRVHVKRSSLGRLITYVTTTDTETLVLAFSLTRQKSLELEAFITSYQSAPWQLEFDHDKSIWIGTLVGLPVQRAAVNRIGDDPRTGREEIEVTLTLSATKLS